MTHLKNQLDFPGFAVMSRQRSAHAQESRLNKSNSSVFRILRNHADRLASNNELCEDLLRELESGLLPPLPETITIPSLPQRASAMPTSWVRTSLFVNKTQTQVKYLRNQVLESINDTKIEFTGEQLNMFDNDVYLEVIRLALSRAPGEQILFTRHSFLRTMGMSGGDNNYKALKNSLQKLKANTITIENLKAGKSFSLIDEFSWDENIGYWFSVGNVVIDIFSRTALSYIDLDARRMLSNSLSKYLQNYMSGSTAGEQEVKVHNLMRLSGTTSQLKDFLGKGRGLLKALDEVKAAGLISSYAIRKNKNDEHVVTWIRIAHKNSKRAL
ncbi:replication initiator protein A [Pseudomonas sp. J452]|uniref:plasmid replication initiator TrfA n=1 Tax=Pseudomonas sp. J452 TaxID=2898441 RepID=UPI0021ADB6C4|nr:plasmid replication initiator TrfA [Pseudomonas sp. J452]UUY09016.1 replication initiator protein A [Pseudomonas sp. J452]